MVALHARGGLLLRQMVVDHTPHCHLLSISIKIVLIDTKRPKVGVQASAILLSCRTANAVRNSGRSEFRLE